MGTKEIQPPLRDPSHAIGIRSSGIMKYKSRMYVSKGLSGSRGRRCWFHVCV
jgi:hypothetical protein